MTWKWMFGVSRMMMGRSTGQQLEGWTFHFRRWKFGNFFSSLAMRWQLRDNSMQSCWSRLPQTASVHVPRWQWKCFRKEYTTGRRSVDGRLQTILLCGGAIGQEHFIWKVSWFNPIANANAEHVNVNRLFVSASRTDWNCVNVSNASHSNGIWNTSIRNWWYPKRKQSAPFDRVFTAWTLWAIWWTVLLVSLSSCSSGICLLLNLFPKRSDSLLGLYQCHDTGGNQEWTFTKKGQIKHHDLCLTLVKFAKGSMIVMRFCDDSENQKWELHDGGLVRHSKMNVCLDTRFVQDMGVTA